MSENHLPNEFECSPRQIIGIRTTTLCFEPDPAFAPGSVEIPRSFRRIFGMNDAARTCAVDAAQAPYMEWSAVASHDVFPFRLWAMAMNAITMARSAIAGIQMLAEGTITTTEKRESIRAQSESGCGRSSP